MLGRLWVIDIEVLRFHYADTLHAWGERFCHMWEYDLVAAEMGFRYGRHMNFQLQLSERAATLPTTRGYMAEVEEAAEISLVFGTGLSLR